MVEQADLFLEFVGMVLEGELLVDILFIYLLDIIELLFIDCQNFRGVIEVDSESVVAQRVSDSVFGAIIDPFLNRN